MSNNRWRGRLDRLHRSSQTPRNIAVNISLVVTMAALSVACGRTLPPCSATGQSEWRSVQQQMASFANASPTAGIDQISVLWLDSLHPATDVAIRLTAERGASQNAASFRSPAGCEAAGGKSGIFLSEGGTSLEPSEFSRVASCLEKIGFWTQPAEPNDSSYFDGTLVVVTATIGNRQHQARRIDTPKTQDFVSCARAARRLVDR